MQHTARHSSTAKHHWFGLVAVFTALLAFFALAAPAHAQAPPTVTQISPTEGPATGGTAVLITGTNFGAVQTVHFDGVPAPGFTFNSSTSLTATAPPHAAGFAKVTVTTAFGTSTDNIMFQYFGPGGGPTVTGLSPNAGPTAGGTPVTISGAGFVGVSSVTFGGVAASFTVNGSGQITATSPAHLAGVVNVRVTTGAGTTPDSSTNQFTYVGDMPVVTSVSPNSGPTTGGTGVVISGGNFTGVTSVTFGGTAALFTFNSANQITATSPAHLAGTVDVRVTTSAGTSAITPVDQFTYTAGGPVIADLSPNSGPIQGGNAVTISGTGFVSVSSVTFDGVGVAFTVNNSGSISTTAPAHSAGTINVRVTALAGISPLNAASQYTYSGSGPAVTGLSPESGPTSGSTIVTITGVNLSGATSVTFGGTAALNYSVDSSTQITAIAPPRTAGSVFVQVTTPAGASTGTAASTFTYTTGGPVITDLNPEGGPVGGGNTVVITGTGLSGAVSVMFGNVNAAFTVNNSTQITATAPAQANAGTVFVRVANSIGTSPQTTASQYTYSGGPVITGLSPEAGPIAGGTTVVITGTGFSGVTAVTFGGVNAPFTVNSSTRITATAPARATSGDVFVRVITTSGTSADVAAAEFTYMATGETVTYTLVFRWTLISWMGIDGIAISNALSGSGVSQVSGASADQVSNIAAQVTAIYRWDAPNQRWQAHFPGSENVPGANDFNTFENGRSYFIAIAGPNALSWVVLRGSPTN